MKFVQHIVLLLAAFAVTTSSMAACADSTHIYKFTYNGKRYEVVKELKGWDSAAACAVARGGYLAHINSQSEQDSIYFAITTGAAIPISYTVVGDGGGIAYVWIGATDKHTEGTWLWDGNNDGTGTNFWTGQGSAGTGGGAVVGTAYAHWGGMTSGAAKEPDNFTSSQHTAAIALAAWPYGIAGEWNDISHTNPLYYVIEYDNPVSVISATNPDEQTLLLYPNPATGTLNVSIGNWNTVIQTVTVLNQVSTVVGQTTEATMDVNHLPTGIYFIQVKLMDGTIIRQTFTKM